MVKTSDSNAGPNLPKAQEQARDTVKEGRNTTAAIDHEFDEFTISGGQASKDAAAESMWLLMDKDNSGTISKAEFKSYYGWEFFRAYWAAALEATEKQKHVAVLRSICDQLRMRKVAAAFRTHTRYDDAIIDNIASFVHLRAV